MQFLLLYVQDEDYQNILKISCWQLAFTSYKTLKKNNKNGLEIISRHRFLHDFSKKNNSHVIFYQLTNFHKFHCLITLLLYNMCIVIIFAPFVTLWILKLILAFLSSRLLTWPKSQDIKLITLKTKRAFKMK